MYTWGVVLSLPELDRSKTEITKKCVHCGETKQISLFGKRSSSKDGFRNVCKDCRKEETIKRKEKQSKINKEYYANNREKERQRGKAYYKENIEKIRNYSLRYCQKNKKARASYSQEYRKQNHEKVINSLARWREKNAQHVLDYSKKYRLENSEKVRDFTRRYVSKRLIEDEEYRIKTTIRSRFKAAMKNGGWRERFIGTGYKYSDYIKHFTETQNELFLLYRTTSKYHIDHIIPVSMYDMTIDDDVKKCWNPRNMRIISVSENLNKKDRFDLALVIKYGIVDLLPEGEYIDSNV